MQLFVNGLCFFYLCGCGDSDSENNVPMTALNSRTTLKRLG